VTFEPRDALDEGAIAAQGPSKSSRAPPGSSSATLLELSHCFAHIEHRFARTELPTAPATPIGETRVAVSPARAFPLFRTDRHATMCALRARDLRGAPLAARQRVQPSLSTVAGIDCRTTTCLVEDRQEAKRPRPKYTNRRQCRMRLRTHRKTHVRRIVVGFAWIRVH
jgi:hypothetical protein